MPTSADAVFRNVVLDPRCPLKLRLEALKSMARPSLRLLYRLAGDRSPKIRFEAGKRLALELSRKELRKRARQREIAANS